MDNFEKRMGKIKPGTSFRVANKLSEKEGEKLSVQLTFEKMEDFGPRGDRPPGSAAAGPAGGARAAVESPELHGREGRGDQEMQDLLKDRDKMAAVRAMLEQARLEKEASDAKGGTPPQD